MKEISVYAIGQQNPKNKHGVFHISLQYNGNKRYIKGIVPNATAKKSVSRGVLTALEKLTEPCSVNVFVVTNIKTDTSGIIEQITSAAVEKGCELNITVCKGKEGKTVRGSAIKSAPQEEKHSKNTIKQLSLSLYRFR